jgi:hypothetical protein
MEKSQADWGSLFPVAMEVVPMPRKTAALTVKEINAVRWDDKDAN